MYKLHGRPLVTICILLTLTMLIVGSFTAASTAINFKNDHSELNYCLPDAKHTARSIFLDEDIDYNEQNSNENLNVKTDTKIITMTMPLSFAQPQIKTESVGGISFSRLESESLSINGLPGEPELFTKTVTFKFKPGTTFEKLEFIPKNVETTTIPLKLTPVQEPIPIHELDMYSYGEPDPTMPNTAIYSSTSIFPDNWFTISKGMGIDMETTDTTLFVNVKIVPIRYNPVRNELIFATDGIINIEYTPPDEQAQTQTQTQTNTARGDDGGAGGRAKPISENYKILIIGPEKFRQNLTRLAEYKNGTGISSKFVSITEIKGGKYFPGTGVDDQEKIKYFIYNAKIAWNITYVILGGDTPEVPHRFVYINGPSAGNVPADLYYADVFNSNMNFDDWDSNNDGTYGEYNNGFVDAVDMYADVFLGRLPASTPQEMKVLVDKIITYESFTSGQPWFDNITMCGTDTFPNEESGVPEGEYAAEFIASNYMQDYVSTKLYETTTYARDWACTTTNIVNTLNRGSGFATFHDHGSPSSWGVGRFSSSNAASLTNGDKLPFLNFDACSTGQFDGSSDSITEVVVLNPNGGSITSIGASRIGWGAYGTNHINRVSGYFNTRLYYNYDLGEGTAGRIFTASKYDYMNNKGISSYYDYMTLMEYTLFGDPSLLVGGIPLKNINISCENNESYVGPSESTNYDVIVSNNGTLNRIVKLYVDGVPENWDASLNETLITVPGNSEKIVGLTVNAPETAVYREIANIEVYAYYSKNKDRALSVVTKTITTRISGMDLNTTKVSDSVIPGEEASYWFKLSNLGNAEDNINLTAALFEALAGWDFNLSVEHLSLAPYAYQLITLKVTPPEETYAGTYSINVSGSIFGYTGEKSKDEIVFEIEVLRIYGLKVTPDDELSKTFLPGDTFTYHLAVANLGNDLEKFKFSLLLYPPTWNITLTQDTAFYVDAFSECIENLTFTIPEQTLIGRYTIKLRTQSKINYTTLQDILFEVKVDRTYGISLELDKNNATLDPREVEKFNLTIIHLGNDHDEVDISAILPSNWYLNLTPSIEMAPFETYWVNFQVMPDEESEMGNYPFQLKVELLGNNNISSINMSIKVNTKDGFDFSCKNINYSLDAGGTQKFSLYLENQGNHDDEIQLNITDVPTSWSVDWTPVGLPQNNVLLGPFKYTNDISIKINTDLKAIAGIYEMQVTGRLQSTGEEITISLFLTINPHYGVKLEIGSSDSIVRIIPGEEFTITINITNEGNSEDEVLRNILDIPSNWDVQTVSNYKYIFGPYERKTEIIRIQVPENETERDVNITIKVSSKSNPDKEDSKRRVVHVEKEPVPPPEDEDEFAKLEEAFTSNFFSLILPIIVLIIAVMIFGFFITRQRKAAKQEMRDLEYAFDPDEETGYDYEAEKLYGPQSHTQVQARGQGAVVSARTRSIPIPRPPSESHSTTQKRSGKGKSKGRGRRPGHKHKQREKDSFHWLDDGKAPKTPYQEQKYSEPQKTKAPMEPCPTCGELVGIDQFNCPYCGESFDIPIDEDNDDWEDLDEDVEAVAEDDTDGAEADWEDEDPDVDVAEIESEADWDDGDGTIEEQEPVWDVEQEQNELDIDTLDDKDKARPVKKNKMHKKVNKMKGRTKAKKRV